jgi:hypothetical protein
VGGREKKSTDARHHRNAPTNTCTFESAVATVDAASSAAAVRSSLDIVVERVLCFTPLPPTQPASVHSSRRGSDAGSLDTRSSVSRGSVMDLLANSAVLRGSTCASTLVLGAPRWWLHSRCLPGRRWATASAGRNESLPPQSEDRSSARCLAAVSTERNVLYCTSTTSSSGAAAVWKTESEKRRDQKRR